MLKFFHKPSLKARRRTYELRSNDRAASRGVTLSIQDAVLIHHANSDVFRATMRRTGENTPFDVVCKVKFQDFPRIRREARFYKRLVKCQGVSIPRCYGLFEGSFAGRPAACLVLEDCGAQLEEPLNATSWTFKYHVINCVIHIHQNGVDHNDIAKRNIVVRPDGRPCLIDFDEATPHKCEAKMDINSYDLRPHVVELGCEELHEAACNMLIWLPRTISYFGRNVDVSWAKTPELLVTQAPEGIIPWYAEARAREVVAEHERWVKWRENLPFE